MKFFRLNALVFISTFYWRRASKSSKLIRPPADWSDCRDVTRRGY